MKSFLSILFFVSITVSSKAQEICLKLDSIECYRIPWQLKSNTHIHKNEIISGESFSSLRVYNIVKDKQALEYFATTNFIDTSKVLSYNQSVKDIDARAVIVIYYSSGARDTIVFNGSASYYYSNKVYLSNIKILLWLQEYSPLANPKTELIKAENINKLKEEYNFMVK